MLNIKRLFKSFKYASRGLFRMFKEEQNLQVQSIVAIIVLVLAVFFGIGRIEWCLIGISIILVLLSEMINSAIERVADILKPRIHEYVKEVKDIMAAVVLLSSFLAIFIGVAVFWPYVLEFFA